MLFFMDLFRGGTQTSEERKREEDKKHQSGKTLKAIERLKNKNLRQNQERVMRIKMESENDNEEVEIIVQEPELKQYDDSLLNMDLLKYYLLKLNQDGRSNRMDLKMYCAMYLEFLKLFIHLGKAIKFAFSDISEKATQMLNNQETMTHKLKMIQEGSPENVYIEQYVLWEIDQGYAFINGDNNKEILGPKKYGEAHKLLRNYTSTTWIFIRGAWFFDYLTEIFRLVYYERHQSMVQVTVGAYETGLARHHPWIVQRAAKVGMYACASRDDFFRYIIEEQREVLQRPEYNTELLYEDALIIYHELDRLRNHIWTFCGQNGVDKVP